METDTTQHAPRPGDRPLRRSTSDRFIAGVAGGIAARLDIPAWVVRLAFAVLFFGGGLGLALYIAGWLLLPADDESEPIAGRLLDRIQDGSGWFGVILVGIGVLIVVTGLDFLRGDLAVAVFLGVIGVMLYRGEIGGSRRPKDSVERPATPTTPAAPAPTTPATVAHDDAPLSTRFVDQGEAAPPPAPPPAPATPAVPPPPPEPPRPPSILGRLTIALTLIGTGVMAFADFALDTFDPTPRHYLGLALGLIGAALVVGSVLGRARGLIFVGIVLAPLLILAPLAEFDLNSGIGRREVRVSTIDEIAASYEMAIGELVIDLRAVDFGTETVHVDTSVGLGSLRILVPPAVGLELDAEVGIGQAQAFGTVRSGFAREINRTREGRGLLVLDAQTLVGEVHVGDSGAALLAGSGTVGSVDYFVTTPDELADSYDMQAGDLFLDFSGLVLTEPRTVHITNSLGRVDVIVPDRATTDVTAHTGLGSVSLFGGQVHGADVTDRSAPTGPALLVLDIAVDSGEIVVEEN